MENLNAIPHDEAAERFALGHMEGQELDDYLARLLLDPALQAQVAAARERIKAMRGMTAPPPPSTASRWRWLLLTMLLVVGGLLFWWLRPNSPAPIPSANPQPLPDTPSSSASRPPIAIQLPTDTQRSTDNGQQPTRRIAADLRPNPALEYLIGSSQYRDNDPQAFRWLRAPETQPVFTNRHGKTRFVLDAVATGPAEAIARLQWQVFTNKASDYAAGRSQQAGQFNVQALGDGSYGIRIQADLALQPGLYYFLVEDQEAGGLYFVGKFVVKG